MSAVKVNGYVIGGGCDDVKLDVRRCCGKYMLMPDVTVNGELQSQHKKKKTSTPDDVNGALRKQLWMIGMALV